MAYKHNCRPQRHLTASEFMTYDAMMACARSKEARKDKTTRDPFIFYGTMTTLANMNNRCRNVEGKNAGSLVKKGWLVRVLDRQQTNWKGEWGTWQYILYDHEDFQREHDKLHRRLLPPMDKTLTKADVWKWKHGVCPKFRYDDEGVLRIKKRTHLDEVNKQRRNDAYKRVHGESPGMHTNECTV
jgi:hypothetical protein